MRAILVMRADKRRDALLSALRGLNLTVSIVETGHEARTVLQGPVVADLVIAEVTLPDGNWCDVLRWVTARGGPAPVLVASSVCDERLWSEVLWRGAYDLLTEPFRIGEVQRIVEGAIRATSGVPRPLCKQAAANASGPTDAA